MVKSIIPMASAKVDADKLGQYWNDENYIAERKYDGSRYLMYMGFGEESRFNIFRSRQVSKKTGETVDKTDNVPHLSKWRFCLPNGDSPKIIFDGEIIVSETASSNEVTSIMGSLPEKAVRLQKERGFVTYMIFDILEVNGVDITTRSWSHRRRFLEKIYENLFKDFEHIQLSNVAYEDKEKFYNGIVDGGGEGVILKNVNAPYRAAEIGGKEYRNKDTWIKVKKYDTFDVVIMGYTEPTKYYTGKHPQTWQHWIYEDGEEVAVTRDYANGWIGAVRFGQYKDGKLVEIGQTDGMSDEDKHIFTRMKQELLGKVMEVGAMEQIAKTGSLRHPRFLKMRPDKNPEQCILGVN